MTENNILFKLFAIVFIGGGCFIGSLLVLGLTHEREVRNTEAREEIAEKWSKKQIIAGPMIVSSAPDVTNYILPERVMYETTLQPEVRSRGIFKSVVYTSTLKVSGEFLASDITRATQGRSGATFSVPITDTRGIERQFNLSWNNTTVAFNPGPGVAFVDSSGLHAMVPTSGPARIPFAFEIELKGSEGMSIAPLGKETVISMSSPWETPKFVGAFLPATREVSEAGFQSQWRISSFGRSYPQTWSNGQVDLKSVLDSAAGVELHEQIDTYDMVFRSVKYAILFIIATFAAFFLFDILAKVRVHPIQYLLIGSALALFYLLLLSLSEQIGFFYAYLVSTTLISGLVTLYSAFVLRSNMRALPIFGILAVLYGYLYFILQLEDYALLFGSLLLFVLIAVIMYATRHIDWFSLNKRER